VAKRRSAEVDNLGYRSPKDASAPWGPITARRSPI